MNSIKNIIIDTDIGGDPDDFFALLYLLSRDDVCIKAITCTPGRMSQIRLLSAILQFCGRDDIPVGIPRQKNIEEKHVNDWHWHIISKSGIDVDRINILNYSTGSDLIIPTIKSTPDILLITIGPLTNIKQAFEDEPALHIQKSFSMGGFIESNEPGHPFPENLQGMKSCQSFNLSGDRKATQLFLDTPIIKEKYFISKNITHLCVVPQSYIRTLNLTGISDNKPHKLLGLALLDYFEDHKKKKFHDPLTVCAALNNDLIRYDEVMIEEYDGKYSSKLQHGTKKFISVGFEYTKFLEIFFQLFK